QRAQAQLGDQDGACVAQPLYDRRVLRRHAVSVRLGAVCGRDTGGVDEVFSAPRDAVQRSAVLARGDLLVGLPGLSERQLACQRDDTPQLRIEAFQAVQIESRQSLRAEL